MFTSKHRITVHRFLFLCSWVSYQQDCWARCMGSQNKKRRSNPVEEQRYPFHLQSLLWSRAGGHPRLSRITTSYPKLRFFSISQFLCLVGSTVTLVFGFRDSLPRTRIQRIRSAALLSASSILRNLNVRLGQIVPHGQKLINVSVQRTTAKANIMW